MAVTTYTRQFVTDMLRAYLRRFEMSATERYEADAERFYLETGMMAPGKDAPAAYCYGSDVERRAGYDAFVARRNDELRDVIAAAVLFLSEPSQSAGAVDPGGELAKHDPTTRVSKSLSSPSLPQDEQTR